MGGIPLIENPIERFVREYGESHGWPEGFNPNMNSIDGQSHTTVNSETFGFIDPPSRFNSPGEQISYSEWIKVAERVGMFLGSISGIVVVYLWLN